MKYAVVAMGGKQYKVAEGDVVDFDYLAGVKANDTYAFDQVLLVVDDKNQHIGTPTVKGAAVTGTIVDHKKGIKVRVAKFKAKVRYRRVTGFRAKLTAIKIDKISA